jgi:hypothetical protein
MRLPRLLVGAGQRLSSLLFLYVVFLFRYALALSRLLVIYFCAFVGIEVYPSTSRAPSNGELLYVQTQFGSVKGTVVSVSANHAFVTFPRLVNCVGCPVFTSEGTFIGTYSLGHFTFPIEMRLYTILYVEVPARVRAMCYESTINFTVIPLSLEDPPVMLVEHNPVLDICVNQYVFTSVEAMVYYFTCVFNGATPSFPLFSLPLDVH